jgi:predicted nucleotidyltransferase
MWGGLPTCGGLPIGLCAGPLGADLSSIQPPESDPRARVRLLRDMSALSEEIATAFYRQAARVSARTLFSSPIVESVMLHRSAATGEVDFGRSDIDMLIVVDEEGAEEGAAIASLCRELNRARLFNPALNHVDVYEPHGIASQARMDTFWASVERRSSMLLRGKAVEIPFAPVHPDHALQKFLLWVEWFFAVSVQQRNRRNLWKTSLECWNSYASAEGLSREPYVLRREMEAQARRIEENLATKRLGEPAYATRFVFELAERLHRSRLPALRKLSKPLVFEAITAPLCLHRRFVVVPRADSPLPPETFEKGAFPCTPEILDLFVHAKNAFFYWILPPELLELGIQPPFTSEFLRACGSYSHSRFLFHPGFAIPSLQTQTARLAIIRHAMDGASRGELPSAIPQEEIREMMAAGAATIAEYYRTEYGRLRRESRQIQESLLAFSGTG